MRLIWGALGGCVGLGIGAAIGFGMALAVSKPRYDGSFGMREILVGLPSGALLGFIAGIAIALKLAR